MTCFGIERIQSCCARRRRTLLPPLHSRSHDTQSKGMRSGTLIASIVWVSISAVSLSPHAQPLRLAFPLEYSRSLSSAPKFQYGYHIASLNAASDAVVSAIGLSTFEFGVVVSAYTVGGLVASLNTGAMIVRVGQVKTAVRAAWAMMLVSPNLFRFLSENRSRLSRLKSFAYYVRAPSLSRSQTLSGS